MVPPRINPADYFMDVISGDAQPTNEDVSRRAVAKARRTIIQHAQQVSYISYFVT